jgi:uridine kinase
VGEGPPDLLDRVAGARVVLVAGPSCAGKTAFTGWLAGHVPAVTLPGDDWALSEADLRARAGSSPPDLEGPDGYDIADLAATVRGLLAGRTCSVPTFSFEQDRVIARTDVALGAGQKLVIEFLHAFDERIVAAVGGLPLVRIFIDAPPTVRYARRYARDLTHRAKTPDQVRDDWQRLQERESAYIAGAIAQADITIDNDGANPFTAGRLQTAADRG